MKIGEPGDTIKADAWEYVVLRAYEGPEPLAEILDSDKGDFAIIGAEYSLEDMDFLHSAALRAKEHALYVLYPHADALRSSDIPTRRTAAEEIRRAVLNDDGSRSRMMRTAIVSSTILRQIEQFNS